MSENLYDRQIVKITKLQRIRKTIKKLKQTKNYFKQLFVILEPDMQINDLEAIINNLVLGFSLMVVWSSENR